MDSIMRGKIIEESLRAAREKFGNDIPSDIIDKFIGADKSKTYKFVYKMCKLYQEGYSFAVVINLFNQYQKISPYIKNVDITNLSFEDISDIIFDANEQRNKSRSALKRSMDKEHVIYKKEGYKIYYITSFKDMQYYGKSTPWCIALNEREYNFYSEAYSIYVVLNLNLPKDSNYYKTCVFLSEVENDIIVGKDNIHHYNDSKIFHDFVKEIYNDDIIKLFKF